MTSIDYRLTEAITDLRWGPVTPAMQLLSAWWMKTLVFLLVAAIVDLLRAGRPRLPLVTAATAAALILASTLSGLLKNVVERPRPPLSHSGITAIGSLPHDWSFPSGHATEAFAAACVLARLGGSRALAWGGLVLACAIALSRVYLGMHYVGDVVAGALLGAVIALALTWAISASTGRMTLGGG